MTGRHVYRPTSVPRVAPVEPNIMVSGLRNVSSAARVTALHTSCPLPFFSFSLLTNTGRDNKASIKIQTCHYRHSNTDQKHTNHQISHTMHFHSTTLLMLLATTTSASLAPRQVAYDAESQPAPPTITPCTTTLTTTRPFGCTISVAATTTTDVYIDCQGCDIATETVVNRLFGHGPVCFGGWKTVTVEGMVGGATGCAASPTSSSDAS